MHIKYILISILIAIFAFHNAVGLAVDKDADYCLRESYQYYKKYFISDDGRVMDPERGDITTSEGQSYFLHRTIAANDPKAFDLSYKWTKEHLQRRDKLFSWIYGRDKAGKYNVLDKNSAGDADVNIALALVLAYGKWDNDKYLKEARPIISSIWKNETKKVGRYRVLMPGFVQTRTPKVEVNPSYFHPYAFKVFKKYDKWHDWSQLVDSSYYYIMESSAKSKTLLPPDWFLIEKGQIVLENSKRSDFSYDAIRVFKNTYWDYTRTGDKRALPVLAKSKFFINDWKKTKTICTNYRADGHLRDLNEFIGSVAILIIPISIYDSKVAKAIFKAKIEPYLHNKSQWSIRKDYYAKNLLWYGCHFYYKESAEHKEVDKLHKKSFN